MLHASWWLICNMSSRETWVHCTLNKSQRLSIYNAMCLFTCYSLSRTLYEPPEKHIQCISYVFFSTWRDPENVHSSFSRISFRKSQATLNVSCISDSCLLYSTLDFRLIYWWDGRGLMLWLFVGPLGFTCWICFAPVFSFIYYRVLIFALSPCYILIYII